MSMPEQVITLVAANSRFMLDVPVKQVKRFQMELLDFVESTHPEIIRRLETDKTLDGEIREEIGKAVGEFKAQHETV